MARLRLQEPRQPAPARSPTPCSVKPVKSWLIPQYWEFVKGYVEDALKHANGELEAQDVYEYLLSERMFLFVAQRKLICGASTCEVVQYVRKKAIRVVTLGGDDFSDWREPLHKVLLEWADKIHADGIEAYVRKGLVSQLEGLGYVQTYVGMEFRNGKKTGHADS